MSQYQPERDFGQFIRNQGLTLEGDPVMDGKVHRIPALDGKPNNKDGAYKGYLDGRPGGWVRNFRDGGEIVKWSAERAQPLTPSQQTQNAADLKAKMAQREALAQQQYLESAQRSEHRWGNLASQTDNDAATYLQRKQVAAFDVRFEGNDVVVPVRDIDGKLWSLQTISPDKDKPKLFEKGARKAGNMHTIGSLEDGKPILVSEGYATGASLAMASARPVAVAFDAGNIDAVVGQLAARYPSSPLLIMADDDRYRDDGKNIGLEKARNAADKHGAQVVIPEFKARDTRPKDFNDLHVLEGLDAVAQQVERAVALALTRETSPTPSPNIPTKDHTMTDATTATSPPPADKIQFTAQRNDAGQFDSFSIKRYQGKDLVDEAKNIDRQRLEEFVGKGQLAAIDARLEQSALEKRRVQGTLKSDQLQTSPAVPAGEKPAIPMGGSTNTTPEPPGSTPEKPQSRGKKSTAKEAEQADLFNRIEPAKHTEQTPLTSVVGTTAYIDTTFQAVAVERDNKVYLLGGTAAIDKYAQQTQLNDSDRDVLRGLHKQIAATPVNAYDTEVLHRVAELQRSRKAQASTLHPALAGERLAPNEVREQQPPAAPPQDALPLDLQRQFLKVQNKFYHADRPDSLAFVDKGNRLETKSDSDRTAAAFVAIADGRGWDTIKVSGSQAFRREVWLEAASRGILVNGYKATDVDRALLEHRIATGRTNAIEQDGDLAGKGLNQPQQRPDSNRGTPGGQGNQKNAPEVDSAASRRATETDRSESNARPTTQPLAGILLEHGPAKYKFDPDESSNYFVKMLDNGKERIVWGVKLGDALQKAGAKEGDKITLERAGAESVVIDKNVRDERGQVVGRAPAGAQRNEWRVEISEESKRVRREQAAEDFKNLPLREAATRHPELLAAAGVMAAATVVARSKFADDKSREQFLDKTRSRVANDVAIGREVGEVRMNRAPTKDRTPKKRPQPEPHGGHSLDRSR